MCHITKQIFRLREPRSLPSSDRDIVHNYVQKGGGAMNPVYSTVSSPYCVIVSSKEMVG